MAKVVVVIPTYNEKENTLKMIDTLADEFAKIKDHDMQLLYVDAKSPDGTAKIVEEKSKKYKWLHVFVEEKKEGLGKAYAKGFKYAIEKLGAEYVMEFDADFQHRPDQIKDLVLANTSNLDFVEAANLRGINPEVYEDGTQAKLARKVARLQPKYDAGKLKGAASTVIEIKNGRVFVLRAAKPDTRN